jgi:hypothetical protein
MQKRSMSKNKSTSTQRLNSYLPLPSHISQSGHLTGAFGGASSTGIVELSAGDSSERNSGLLAYCLAIGSPVKPEDDPTTRQATAAKSIRENETGFIMVEKQNL